MRTPAAGWRRMLQPERADGPPWRLRKDGRTSDVLAHQRSVSRLEPAGSARAMPLQPSGDVMAYSLTQCRRITMESDMFERTPPAGTCRTLRQCRATAQNEISGLSHIHQRTAQP